MNKIHILMKNASDIYLKPHLQYSTEPIVLVDIISNTYSAIYDACLTKVFWDNFIKITGWYDNESEYDNKFVDLNRKLDHYELGLS